MDDLSDDSISFTDSEVSHVNGPFLKKRQIQDCNRFRRGPIPIEDDFPSLPSVTSIRSYPGQLCEEMDSKYKNDLQHKTDTEISLAATYSLFSYFLKLASSVTCLEMNVAFVDALVNAGADVNLIDFYQQSLMHEVARQWNTDAAQLLFDHGALIDYQDRFGRRPLHLACAANNVEIVKWLLANRVDVHSKSKAESKSAIHYAAEHNAGEVIDVLLDNGADISDLDYKQRTPLFVAAEKGHKEACRILLKKGAPAGVYDDSQTALLTVMVETMPEVAKEALEQFAVLDNNGRTISLYLNYLTIELGERINSAKNIHSRSTCTRSPLEAIVNCDAKSLVIHPIIRRIIKVKMRLFGRKYLLLSLFAHLLFALIWTAVGFGLSRKDHSTEYFPLEDKAWRICLEIMVVLMAICFMAKEVAEYQRRQKNIARYKKWRLMDIMRVRSFCHPCWPIEKELLDEAAEMVDKATKGFFHDPWRVFEWGTFVAVFIVVVLRAVSFNWESRLLYEIFHRTFAVLTILVWGTVVKCLRYFLSLGQLICLIKYIFMDLFFLVLLYILVSFPFANAFWIVFGLTPNTEFYYFNDMLYQIYLMTIGGSFDLTGVIHTDHHFSDTLISVYLGFSRLFFLNLFIAMLTLTSTKRWRECLSEALLLQATELLAIEESLSTADQLRISGQFLKDCSPMVVPRAEFGKDIFAEKELILTLRQQVDKFENVLRKEMALQAKIKEEVKFLRSKVFQLKKSKEEKFGRLAAAMK